MTPRTPTTLKMCIETRITAEHHTHGRWSVTWCTHDEVWTGSGQMTHQYIRKVLFHLTVPFVPRKCKNRVWQWRLTTLPSAFFPLSLAAHGLRKL